MTLTTHWKRLMTTMLVDAKICGDSKMKETNGLKLSVANMSVLPCATFERDWCSECNIHLNKKRMPLNWLLIILSFCLLQYLTFYQQLKLWQQFKSDWRSENNVQNNKMGNRVCCLLGHHLRSLGVAWDDLVCLYLHSNEDLLTIKVGGTWLSIDRTLVDFNGRTHQS